MFLIMAEYILK